MTIVRIALERGAAARAVAGSAYESGAALGAELGIRFGARAVRRACGTGDGGRGMSDRWGKTHPPSLVPRLGFRPERGQSFGGVFGLQRLVIGVREFPRRPIELDLL